MKAAVRSAFAILCCAIVYGACFLVDVRPERRSDWSMYLALTGVAGALFVCVECIAGRIWDQDATGDRLWLRALRLCGSLLLGALALALLGWIMARM